MNHSVKDTARHLSLSQTTVYRKLESGEWAPPLAVKVGTKWSIDVDAVKAHLANFPVHPRNRDSDPMPRVSVRRRQFREKLEASRA